MIYVSHQLPVNAPGQPRLDRQAVWDGLVRKANNALPFVPSMTFCEVTAHHDDTTFDRDIDFRGDRFTERITLEAPHRVVFTRIAGPVLGTIANEIEDTDQGLQLRFSFALVVAGVEGGQKIHFLGGQPRDAALAAQETGEDAGETRHGPHVPLPCRMKVDAQVASLLLQGSVFGP